MVKKIKKEFDIVSQRVANFVSTREDILSQNQFVNSLQGILEDEYIATKARFETLDPSGDFGLEPPSSNIEIQTNINPEDEDILGYFK